MAQSFTLNDLHARGIALAEVEAELGARTRQSGLDEKSARKGG